MKVLEAKDCYIGYTKPLFGNISFQLDFGEVLNIYGENGVGKTTLLKAFLGISILKGEIKVLSKNLLELSPLERAKLVSVMLGETIRVDITVKRYFELSFSPMSLDLIEAFELKEILNKTFKELSTGQNRKVQLVRALSSPAPVIALDEPYAHLDEKSKIRLTEIIEDILKKGKVLIITSHKPLGFGKPFKLPPSFQ